MNAVILVILQFMAAPPRPPALEAAIGKILENAKGFDCDSLETDDSLLMSLAEDDVYLFTQRGETFLSAALKDAMPDELKKIRDIDLFQPPEKLPALQQFITSCNNEKADKNAQRPCACISARVAQELEAYFFGRPSVFGRVIQDWNKLYSKYRSKSAFQSARWGDTLKEVVRKFPKGTRVSDGQYDVKTDLAGKPAELQFLFVYGRLAIVDVVFTDVYLNPDLHVTSYRDVNDLLVRKYGEPKPKDEKASNEANGNSLLDSFYLGLGGMGRAIRRGSETLQGDWADEETSIMHRLSSVDMKIRHSVTYVSKVFGEQYKEVAAELKAGDL